jgi:restriction endonuclease Mrr
MTKVSTALHEEDRLGLDVVYIKEALAAQSEGKNSSFVGALAGNRRTKEFSATTSDFADTAKRTPRTYPCDSR